MSPHTPGPWRAALDPDWQRREDEHRVEVACIPHGCWDAIDVFGPKAAHHDCDSPAQHIANARLIASAPEMYEALKTLVAQILDYERANNLSPSPGRKYCWDSTERAVAAIAKAEGE